ncbi:MAG: serine hydrolase [Candidatus Levybacteria bacterium]|nr:serine hydrolase [Candidatus Levybacteria bacterium]
MENQFNSNQSSGYYKRRIAAILVFAVFFIMLGRHLTFLPVINLSRETKETDLKKEIAEITKDKKGFYSYYFKDLKTDRSFGVSQDQIETGASVNKLPIIAALYYLDSQGEIDLDDRVTIQENDVQDYGTGSIRYREMPQTYSLKNLAKLALKNSDNTAAHVISITVGEDKVQELVNSWGMSQTDMVNNKTTAYDMGLLFQKIYDGEITSAAKTKELLGFMMDTDFEDRLANNLPNSARISHKSGDGEGFVHDVGIIQTEENVYYLGIMTSDIGENEEETKNTIAEISKKIFESVNN